MMYYYAWLRTKSGAICPKRATLYRRPCRVLARGRMNSVLVEFSDGQREVVSRNAVRRIKE